MHSDPTPYEMIKIKAEKTGLLFESYRDYGSKRTLKGWLDYVENGFFIDYDGHGYLATDNQVSNIPIIPSEAKAFKFPDWCTHICWYNR
jgi:hypothetical protein